MKCLLLEHLRIPETTSTSLSISKRKWTSNKNEQKPPPKPIECMYNLDYLLYYVSRTNGRITRISQKKKIVFLSFKLERNVGQLFENIWKERIMSRKFSTQEGKSASKLSLSRKISTESWIGTYRKIFADLFCNFSTFLHITAWFPNWYVQI